MSKLSAVERRVILDLLNGSSNIKKNFIGNSFFYDRVDGDRPSNFVTRYVRVANATMDSLFRKGWIARPDCNSISEWKVIIPYGVCITDEFPELASALEVEK